MGVIIADSELAVAAGRLMGTAGELSAACAQYQHIVDAVGRQALDSERIVEAMNPGAKAVAHIGGELQTIMDDLIEAVGTFILTADELDPSR